MTDQQRIQAFFSEQGLTIDPKRQPSFEQFVNHPDTKAALEAIRYHQQQLMERWKIQDRVLAIEAQHLALPNGTVGKPYEALLDLEKWGWSDLEQLSLDGFAETGLSIDATHRISGTPLQSGDLPLVVRYRIAGEAPDAPLHERPLVLIVNPDPRTLWKTIPSNGADPHAKPDEAREVATLGDRTLVAASKRGRSHANTGGFREDHFAFAHFPGSGWSVVAISDGAGSASLSRKGSAIACQAVIDWFREHFDSDERKAFEGDLEAADTGSDEERQKRMSAFIYTTLQGAAWKAHKEIEAFATANGASLRDLHSTLVFSAFRKVAGGYVFLTFSVGDCPIALLPKEGAGVTLLNRLDVGEFSGGTRFITMPEIFAADQFPARINYKLVPDFGYLLLMTDGIYDPKFGVEANLERGESWTAFLNDLAGQNEAGQGVDLQAGNAQAGDQLLQWMDFWSPGNHDDRTLLIVF